jgi:hypothetical protein
MQKTQREIAMESVRNAAMKRGGLPKTFSGRRGRFFVFVARKLGRVNPRRIAVDGFDFLKVLDQVGNVVNQVSNTAGQVGQVVGQIKTTFQQPAPPIQQTYVPQVQQTQTGYPGGNDFGGINPTYLFAGIVLLLGAVFIFKK